MFLTLLLVFAAGTSLMSPGNASSTDHLQKSTVKETVTWTIPANQCPSLPAGVSVSGIGQRQQLMLTNMRPNGTSQVTINDTVRGDAVDSAGNSYRFFYHNVSHQNVPAMDGQPIRVHMIDVFVLHGQGVTGFRVSFNWTWTYTPPAGIFPPVDNFHMIATNGEPFLCDPI
jgi:hypothetical protein